MKGRHILAEINFDLITILQNEVEHLAEFTLGTNNDRVIRIVSLYFWSATLKVKNKLFV